MSILKKVQAAGFEGVYRPLPAEQWATFLQDVQKALQNYGLSDASRWVFPADYSAFLQGIPAYVNRGMWHSLYSHRELLGDMASYGSTAQWWQAELWLKIGWQGARDNIWLCAEKSAEQWGQIKLVEHWAEAGERYSSFENYIRQL